MINKRCAILLAIVFTLLGSSASISEEIHMSSDYLEYDEKERYAVAKDSVSVSWQENLMTAENVDFNLKEKTFSAKGNVFLDDGVNKIHGDEFDYDYKSGSGTIKNALGFGDPWYFSAKEMLKKGEARYVMKGVNFSNCDHDSPHFMFKSSKVNYKVQRRITSYNTFFYYRGIPVMYLPFFSYGMGPHKDNLEIYPGYNKEDGFICRVIWGYPLSTVSYGKLYLDYYGKRGTGKGAQYIYDDPDKVRADVYGYHIEEKTTASERWNLQGSYWQRLSSYWTVQAQADFLSDTSFVNNYFQNSWSASNQRLHSFLAFSRQSGKNSTRIITERYDIFQPLLGGFDPYSITIPRIEYLVYPKKIGKFYSNFSSSLQNQYLTSNDYYAVSGNADYNLTTDYRLSRKLTLKPRIGASESWQDRTSKLDLTDIFVTRYYTDLNLRHRVANWIDWDYSYGLKIRTRQNSFLQDINAIDYGRESNIISFANSMYIRSITLRNSIAYNLNVNRNEIVKDWREKFLPLVNELSWVHPKNIYVYLREEGNVYPWSLNSIQAYANFGKVQGRYFNFGVFYQSAYPDNLDFATGFGFWPGKKWRLDYVMRTTSLNRFSGWRVNDEEIKIFRNIHCWEFKIRYRKRLDNEEITFNIGLNSTNKSKRWQLGQFSPW